MEPSPVGSYNPHASKKKVVSGSGSGDSPLVLDDDVIEISPPPLSESSKQKLKRKQKQKQKQVIFHEVIDVDNDEDQDLRIIEDNSFHISKGKRPVNSHHDVDMGPTSHNSSSTGNKMMSYLEDYYDDWNDDNLAVDDECAMLQAHFDSIDVPSGIESAVPWWPSPNDSKYQVLPPTSFIDAATSKLNGSESLQGLLTKPLNAVPNPLNIQQNSSPWFGFYPSKGSSEKKSPFGANFPYPGWIPAATLLPNISTGGIPHFQDNSVVLDQGIAAEISGPSDKQDEIEDLIVKKLESFKKFDTVQDHSDHHYSSKKKSQPSKGWVKKIQEEWRMLEKDLPDTIFVRVYETRMDLLRAVIIGAEGTPYHDGTFFFDVQFPSSYPNAPPQVYYHSGGLRLNPNLYNNGKVCLSLLNTWTGVANEKWVPGLSTTLQVLVSIQGLILNAKPYFNEPGCVGMQGSAVGEKQSEAYNENTFLLSLKTMLYSMRRPPKYYEDFVFGHFHKHAHEILIACKSYLDGAQIGTLVKGGIQDVDVGDKSCSNTFKMYLPVYINNLVQAFTKIGVKGCEKYSVPVDNTVPVPDKPSSSSSRTRSTSKYRKSLALKMKL